MYTRKAKQGVNKYAMGVGRDAPFYGQSAYRTIMGITKAPLGEAKGAAVAGRRMGGRPASAGVMGGASAAAKAGRRGGVIGR